MNKRKPVYPSKTTLNLVMKERSTNYYPKMIGFILAAAILVAVFCKFAVIDRLAAADEAQSKADAAQAELDDLVAANADYDTVRIEYDKYFSGAGVTAVYVDCMDVIELIEAKIMPSATVYSSKLSDNKLTVVLTGIGLNEGAKILGVLSESELVQSADLGTASMPESETSSITIDIVLNVKGGAAQ